MLQALDTEMNALCYHVSSCKELYNDLRIVPASTC